MKNFWLKYNYQIILLFTGIIWIVFFSGILQLKDQAFIYPDADNYRESASFLYHNFQVHYYRPMGMALIFGIPYLFGGGDAAVYAFSFFVNIICWLGTALLLFYFLKKFISQDKAFWFTLLFYALLGPLCNVFHLLTETLYTFLIFCVIFLIDKYNATRLYKYLSLALGLLIFLILIKPGAKFLAIVLILFYSRTLLKNWYKASNAFICLPLLMIVFQCVKMKEQYGDYTISYIDGVTYYNYLGNTAMTLKTGETFKEGLKKRGDYIFSLPYTETKEVAANDFKDQLKNNKINLVRAYFSDIIYNSKMPSGYFDFCVNLKGKSYYEKTKSAMIVISKYQNRIFSVIGLILALYYFLRSFKKADICTLISFYILYTIAISGISSHEGDRFHIVFFPFVILLMGKLYADKYHKKAITVQ